MDIGCCCAASGAETRPRGGLLRGRERLEDTGSRTGARLAVEDVCDATITGGRDGLGLSREQK